MDEKKLTDILSNADIILEKALVIAHDQSDNFEDKPPFARTDEWLNSCGWRNCIITEYISTLSEMVNEALETLCDKARQDKAI